MTAIRRLRACRHWIFDLDGTLTLAVHDFDALRRELGLPAGVLILEALAALPEPQRQHTAARLDALEAGLVQRTAAASGAHRLLGTLSARGCSLGIVTRNSRRNALATLRHVGLDRWFDPEHVLGRDEAAPKPDPDGLLRLLRGWQAEPADGVMVGDFRLDLEAGRRAGVLTVHADRPGRPWPDLTDLRVASLDILADHLDGTGA